MPNFDIDVEIDEFVDALRRSEIDELIDYLKEEGHLKSNDLKVLSNNGENIHDNMWFETCRKLLNNRLQLSNEEQEIIEKIAKKFL
jgi:thioredoxin-like negative regulator of GroEL